MLHHSPFKTQSNPILQDPCPFVFIYRLFRINVVILSIFFSYSSSAWALEGGKEIKDKGTYMKIAVTERVDVEEDLLIGNLRIEVENKDPKIVQNKINKVMKMALEKAKEEKSVLAATEQYSVYKYDPVDKDGKKMQSIWRGSQGLRLQSSSSEDLLRLAGSLQNIGLIMNNMNYSLSAGKIDSVRDSLMETVIEKLLKKSKRVAVAIGRKEVEILSINIDSQDFNPYPVPVSMLSMDNVASRKMEDPVVLPGQSQINMSVSATILLKD